MARILYFAFPSGPAQGGHKMILRHVEALRDLGFDAWCVIGPDHVVPTFVEHRAPILRAYEPQPDDVLVMPDDAHDTLTRTPPLGLRTVVFVQGPYIMSALSIGALDSFPADRQPTFMAITPGVADFVRRLYPAATVDVVPCFVDERLFRPRAKRDLITCTPKKRGLEMQVIYNLFRKLHPRHRPWYWAKFEALPEIQFAQILGEGSLHLSLARLEGLGLTALEAMASGAVCAGFLGVGGRQYGTPENGFWVADDECMAAADALGQAADLVRTGGPALARMIDAGQETARRWSYAAFRVELERFWSALAPDARRSPGPLPTP